MKLNRILKYFLISTIFILTACKVNYSFTGMNISPQVKSFSVAYFNNRAALVNPTLSQTFTEELRESIRRQTSLDEVRQNGDIEFEGMITNYSVTPRSIQEGDQAALNRLTITVKVKYINNVDVDQTKEQSFSSFADFDNNLTLTDIEDTTVPEIIDKLIEDILNATLSNW